MKSSKNKLLFIIFTCLLFSLQVGAQQISVSSFKLMENDLTANTYGTMEKDFNGEVAALIKVVTTEQGFLFDGGMVGIVKTKQGVGEMWVYVPHGIKKMTIQHPQLGVLRDYYFPVPIEKARTYEMVLTTGKVQTFVSQSLKKQFVLFTVSPANASLEFNGELLELDETGYAEIGMPYGTYNYRVTCPDHHTTAGTVEVKDGGPSEVNIQMRPDYGWLEVKTAPTYDGATIYINGKKDGVAPLAQRQMKSGIYRVKLEKPLYKDYETSVTIEDGKMFTLEVTEMVPNFATVELVVDEKSEIWVDGELKGIGKWNGALGIGDHQVETRQASHMPSSETVRIFDTEARVIQLKLPTPLHSSMEITSVPSRAKVYIDGKEVGFTPMVLNEVLIGEREMVFEKEGYPRHTKYVKVEYGVNSSVKAILTDPSEQRMTNVSVQPVQQSVQPVVSPSEPVVNSSPSKQAVKEEDNEVKLTVKHPSNYSLYINDRYKGGFTGDEYMLEDLYPGNYKIKVQSKKYVGSKKVRQKKFSTDLYISTKRKNNYFHSNASIYAGGTLTAEESYLGFKVGGYIKGINAEFSYVGLDGDGLSNVRLGYGFKLGRNWLLTPQVGYYRWSWSDIRQSDGYGKYYDDYGIPFGESFTGSYDRYQYWEFYSGISLACRVQHCLSRYMSVAVAPGWCLLQDDDYGLDYVFDAEFSLIFTLPFTKK